MEGVMFNCQECDVYLEEEYEFYCHLCWQGPFCDQHFYEHEKQHWEDMLG
jgi:hypothetical protein